MTQRGSDSGGGDSGKVMLITGATGGIGKATARALATQGHEVVLVGRNPAKTEEVARQIGARGVLVGDLSELREVRRVADEFRDRYGRLDVLINNAGAMFQERRETAEGLEMTWALNHLSPFVLTHELMSLLLVTPQARVITLSSMMHGMGRIRFDDPEFRRGGYNGWAAYAQSKLANILFARELARRGGGLHSYALHPGVVATSFSSTLAGPIGQTYKVVDRFSVTPEVGAQTSVYLASTTDPLPNGGYFVSSKPAPASARALDDGAAARLWALSDKYLANIPAPSSPTWPEILREVHDLTHDTECG